MKGITVAVATKGLMHIDVFFDIECMGLARLGYQKHQLKPSIRPEQPAISRKKKRDTARVRKKKKRDPDVDTTGRKISSHILSLHGVRITMY